MAKSDKTQKSWTWGSVSTALSVEEESVTACKSDFDFVILSSSANCFL